MLSGIHTISPCANRREGFLRGVSKQDDLRPVLDNTFLEVAKMLLSVLPSALQQKSLFTWHYALGLPRVI